MISQYENERDKAHKNSIFYQAAGVITRKYVQQAKSKHKCMLCSRGLDAGELEHFVESNEKKIKEFESPDTLKDTQGKKKAAEAKLKELSALKSLWDDYQRLKNEDLPSTQTRLDELALHVAEFTEQISQKANVVDTLTIRRETLSHSLQLAIDISKLYRDVVQRQQAVAHSTREMQQAASGGRNLEVVQAECDEADSLNMTLNTKLNESQKELEHARSLKQTLLVKVNDLKDKAAQVIKLQNQKERFKQDRDEIRALQTSLQEQIKTLSNELQPLKDQVHEMTQERQELRKENKKLEDKMGEKLQKLRTRLFAFTSLLNEVQEYERNAGQRAALDESMYQCKQELDRLQNERDRVGKERQAKDKVLAESRAIDIDIQANVEYRSRLAALKKYSEQLEEQKRVLLELTQEDDVAGDIEACRNELDQLKNARAELRGALTAEEHQAKEYMDDLNTDRYRDIDRRYNEKKIEVDTTKLAHKDLETYYKALDEALMRFHFIKMKEINNVLKDYWRSTYKGKDIDEVELHARIHVSRASIYSMAGTLVSRVALSVKLICSSLKFSKVYIMSERTETAAGRRFVYFTPSLRFIGCTQIFSNVKRYRLCYRISVTTGWNLRSLANATKLQRHPP